MKKTKHWLGLLCVMAAPAQADGQGDYDWQAFSIGLSHASVSDQYRNWGVNATYEFSKSINDDWFWTGEISGPIYQQGRFIEQALYGDVGLGRHWAINDRSDIYLGLSYFKAIDTSLRNDFDYLRLKGGSKTALTERIDLITEWSYNHVSNEPDPINGHDFRALAPLDRFEFEAYGVFETKWRWQFLTGISTHRGLFFGFTF